MLTTGMYISDRYEIVGKVGTGGMSDVFKAKDHILGRNVAIKVLKKEFSEDRNFVVKFRTEAQSAAGLEHPNIVNIYDVGSEEGFHYIVMEYVEGITLKTYIEKKGQLSFKEAVSIAIQVARGIEAAHNKDIIHRDIKPQNIIISTEGKVKVTDFGIAKAISSNTVSSDVMGSVHYTSPEHARNGQVDGRSDIYSLGIVMYEMVTGRVPFDGDTTVAVAIQHLQEEMVQPSAYTPNLPISMEKIIMKCTQKNPERRYQTIAELLDDLRKSLVTPNEDFVIIPSAEGGATKVISSDELKNISEAYPETPEETEEEDFEDDDFEEDEDEDDDTGILNPKMNKAVTIMFIVVSVIILILIIFIIGQLLGLFGYGKKESNTGLLNNPTTQTSETETQKEEFAMIDIIGLSVAEADEKLKGMGLTLQVVEQVDSDNAELPPGSIVEATPDVGETVHTGDVISVKIVKTDQISLIDVPNVVGKSEVSAKQKIKDAGFKYEVNYEYSDTVERGKVIRQKPEDGTLAKDGTVRIWVSQGPKDITMPNVVGKSKDDAKATLEALGLKVEIVEKESDDANVGKVIEQSIAADKKTPADSTVKITIGKKKEVVAYKAYCNISGLPTEDEIDGEITWELVDSQDRTIESGTLHAGDTTITASDTYDDKYDYTFKLHCKKLDGEDWNKTFKAKYK